MHGDVVIQVTNLAGTKVWAASSAIAKAPVLARSGAASRTSARLSLKMVRTSRDEATLSQISSGQIGSIATSAARSDLWLHLRQRHRSQRGRSNGQPGGLVPLLLLMTGGSYGSDGLALAPVESIAAASTPSRPRTSRNECPRREERRNRAHGPHGQCHVGPTRSVLAVRAGIRLQRESRTAKSAHHAARDDRTSRQGSRSRDWNEVGESSCARAADSKR